MTDENDMYAAAGYREIENEGHGHRSPVAHPHAALVRDEQLSRYLSVVQTHFDPERADRPDEMPGQARDLREWQDIVGVEATESGREAMENGDMATLKHQTGQQDQQADISGIKAISTIDEIIDSPAPVVVLLGAMGMGKTDFAGLIGQRKASRASGDVVVGSNIKTLQERTTWTDSDGNERDGWIQNFPTFREWMEQDGDPVHNDQSCKIMIGDEFSVSAGGQGKQGYQTATKLAKAIYLARKYRVTLIIIAHGPRSVHPLAWRVGKIIKKTAKKQATIAEKITGGSISGIQGKIEGIPPTDWRFDTADTAPWSWTRSGDTDDEPEPDEVARNVAIWTVRECQSEGLSYRATARYVPYGKDWVADRWEEIQDGEHQTTIDMVEELTT